MSRPTYYTVYSVLVLKISYFNILIFFVNKSFCNLYNNTQIFCLSVLMQFLSFLHCYFLSFYLLHSVRTTQSTIWHSIFDFIMLLWAHFKILSLKIIWLWIWLYNKKTTKVCWRQVILHEFESAFISEWMSSNFYLVAVGM